MFTTRTCSECPAQIIWAITTNALWMPVDAEVHPDGNVALSAGPSPEPVATVLGTAKRFGRRDLRRSHFVTCPAAARLRKRGRPA